MSVHEGHRQRMRRQLKASGMDSLSDVQVLEVLLYYAIPRRDTNELAHRLIQHFGTLDAVLQAPPEALMQVSGIGENAAVLLNLVPAAQRCARRSVSAERILNSVERCGAYFMDLLDGQRRELLYQVCLDGKGKVLSCKCLSQGSADMTSLSIRQVVENALLSGAAGVVLGHNHPSGVALPSAEDRAARRTEELREKGIEADFDEVLADMRQRDYNDENRAEAPLRAAADAVRIDTTGNTLEESVAILEKLVRDTIG